jgi:hypothetical protein
MLGLFRRKPPPPPVPISFCTPSKGRLTQLSQTAGANLETALRAGIPFQFVYLDVDCPDGVADWIHANLREFSAHIRLYRTTAPVPVYSIPRADNTAMKLAATPAIANLMADTFVTLDFFREVSRLISEGDRIFVRAPKEKAASTGGLLALWKTRFLDLGGYDETFERWGYQEVDLRHRAEKLGLKMTHWPADGVRAIEHDDALRNRFDETHAPPSQSNLENRERSRKNIEQGKLVANQGKPWGDIPCEQVEW